LFAAVEHVLIPKKELALKTQTRTNVLISSVSAAADPT